MQFVAKIPVAAIAPLSLPQRLEGLSRLAYNFYWSWHPEVQKLFSRINPTLWSQGTGPVEILQRCTDFTSLLADAQYLQSYDDAIKAFDSYIATDKTWFTSTYPDNKSFAQKPITYFCAEFGMHESFPIYSGGLGILAGDHCKEASDMALPFVAVGLFYKRGFFKQMVDADGRQEHWSPTLQQQALPIKRVLDPKTQQPLTIDVKFAERNVSVAVWLATVGRIPLLLLDTDLPQNSPNDRPMTHQLYVSGRDMRLHQEVILGIGGVRALRALNIEPAVWHMNEGHSAFLLIERMREYHLQGQDFNKSLDLIKNNSVFTIHTPVPAGNERFWREHVVSILNPIISSDKLNMDMIFPLAQGADKDPNWFDMTAMGLRLSQGRNGVSLLHGVTAHNTWHKAVNGDVIGVTNGVHMPTWLGASMKKLFATQKADFSCMTDLNITKTGQLNRPRWENILSVEPKKLWDAHVEQKQFLAEFAKNRMLEQLARHGKGPGELSELTSALNPNAFIIGFARRFATYKRASLMFSDEKRLLKMLDNPNKPVQIIFAGKAHPADKEGQKLIAKIFQQTQSKRFRGKVFYIEEYNMEVGRALVQGVDMWLNNPRRPLEASGTSGMKAAANGVPNMSILDGWWDEAWDNRANCANGFAIGGRTVSTNDVVQDKNDAVEFYQTLENKVLPLYFNKNADGIPVEWIKVMQNSIASCVYDFSTMRMLSDYMEKLYIPAAK